MFAEVYESYYGPVRNHWGYIIELAIIDDTMITRTRTPYSKRLDIRYFFDEADLYEYIQLINQDRRF